LKAGPAAVLLSTLPAVAVADAGNTLGPGQALQVLAGLGLVLGLIAAVAWLTRKLRSFQSPGGAHIRIIEGLSLGAREKLLLVQVDGRRVLLATCPGRIATLHSFPADDEPASFGQALARAEHGDTDAAA
jgi:flagellar protein FliO/FliZ